jgi:hypothetical protein
MLPLNCVIPYGEEKQQIKDHGKKSYMGPYHCEPLLSNKNVKNIINNQTTNIYIRIVGNPKIPDFPAGRDNIGQFSNAAPNTKRNIQNSFWSSRSLIDRVIAVGPDKQLIP